MVKKKTTAKIPWAVFIAIALAFIVGSFVGKDGGIFGLTFYSVFDLIGVLFIRSLTMIVVPLVASSIILGVSKVGGEGSFGRLTFKIFAFYFITSVLAVLVGLFFVNILKPGVSDSLRYSIQEGLKSLPQGVAMQEARGLKQLVLSIVPSNIFQAFSEGAMLAVIFFSILFGYGISRIPSKGAMVLRDFFDSFFEATLATTHIIMKTLPLGVFCLVAKVAAETGFSSLSCLGMFFLTVVGALLFFSLVVLPLLLKFIGKVSPLAVVKAMAPALITAFSTSSSSATIPATMECAEKRAGVSNRICGLVIPLGISINMSGSALFECVGAMFIAQAYGIEMSIVAQFSIVMVALLTSMGVAGIPAGSLVALVIILQSAGLPVEGIGLFIAVERILDMCRTTVNIFSDSCCAILVAKTEGETGVLEEIL